MKGLLAHFSIDQEREDPRAVIDQIDSDASFRGTNLWILVFAIFIASLGLNVNSTAVVIGAMLVSPLMGPIMGIGIGMAINDIALLKKAISNYLLAVGVAFLTSTIFFTLSPIGEASSELLARTSPNVYDVLIAIFGGFAGILAVASKRKGNVVPGVAIATALMPPLCTAGYGVAHWNVGFLLGAAYLFVINTVFIAWATLVTARVLRFPLKQLPEKSEEKMAQRLVWFVVVATLLPSIYFAYDIVQQERFTSKADQFIKEEASFPNDYLLKRSIDAKKHEITLTYGGQFIAEQEIEALKKKLADYGMPGTTLTLRQGFSYLDQPDTPKNDNAPDPLSAVVAEKNDKIDELTKQMQSEQAQTELGKKVFEELKIQYPSIVTAVVQPAVGYSGDGAEKFWLAMITTRPDLKPDDKKKISSWLAVRLSTDKVEAQFTAAPAEKPRPSLSPTASAKP